MNIHSSYIFPIHGLKSMETEHKTQPGGDFATMMIAESSLVLFGAITEQHTATLTRCRGILDLSIESIWYIQDRICWVSIGLKWMAIVMNRVESLGFGLLNILEVHPRDVM